MHYHSGTDIISLSDSLSDLTASHATIITDWLSECWCDVSICCVSYTCIHPICIYIHVYIPYESDDVSICCVSYTNLVCHVTRCAVSRAMSQWVLSGTVTDTVPCRVSDNIAITLSEAMHSVNYSLITLWVMSRAHSLTMAMQSVHVTSLTKLSVSTCQWVRCYHSLTMTMHSVSHVPLQVSHVTVSDAQFVMMRMITDCDIVSDNASDCNRLQQTATDCNRLQQTATDNIAMLSLNVMSVHCHCQCTWHHFSDCNRLQQTATDCNRLQQITLQCYHSLTMTMHSVSHVPLQVSHVTVSDAQFVMMRMITDCDIVSDNASDCNRLQQTATDCNRRDVTVSDDAHYRSLWHCQSVAVCCSLLQSVAVCCSNTLWHCQWECIAVSDNAHDHWLQCISATASDCDALVLLRLSLTAMHDTDCDALVLLRLSLTAMHYTDCDALVLTHLTAMH